MIPKNIALDAKHRAILPLRAPVNLTCLILESNDLHKG
jgi:hypothetical protein